MNRYKNCKSSPTGGKIETKSKLIRQLGDTIDLSTFDYQSGRHQMLNLHTMPSTSISGSGAALYQRSVLRRSLTDSTGTASSPSPSAVSSSSSPTPSVSSASMKQHPFEYR